MKPTNGIAARISLVLLALLLAPALFSARAAEPVFAFEPEATPADPNRGLPPDELYYHPRSELTYSENWHFMAKLDQGYVVYTNLIITNMGLTQPSCGVEFSILGTDGKRYSSKRDYEKKDIQASTTSYSVKVADNQIGGTYPRYQLHLSQDGLLVDLSYENILPGWKLNSGTVYFGAGRKDFFKYAITSPSAKVSGTLKFEGKELKVTGFGFQDHSLMTIPPTSFSKRWYHFRSFSDKSTIIFTEILTSDDYQPGRIVLALAGEGNKIVWQGSTLELKLSDLTKDDEFGYAWPGKAEVKLGDGAYTLTGTITNQRLLERIVVLSHLPTMVRGIVHTFIAKPVYYRCLNNFDFTVKQGGAERKLAGEAVNEVVFIR